MQQPRPNALRRR